jgi:hypothetical protein
MPELQSDSERVGSWALLAAAIAAVVLYSIGLAELGTSPAATEPGPQLTKWFVEHGGNVQSFVWSITVATPLLATTFALLRRLLPPPHSEVFLIGAITMLATTAVHTWMWAGLALHAEKMRPPVVRTVLDVAIFYGPVLTGATTTMIAPVTLLAIRRRAGLPRWLGVLGVIAFAEQAAETITIFGSTGFTQPGGAMNMQLGAGLTLAWLLSFAIWGGFRGRFDHSTA